ncbi:hypothetical protein BT69DRAFT_1257733 [Atractiella rhizophila]|nr:hypothetical protein BT69DRAFT_1257733 [Atractiella rhizophila]
MSQPEIHRRRLESIDHGNSASGTSGLLSLASTTSHQSLPPSQSLSNTHLAANFPSSVPSTPSKPFPGPFPSSSNPVGRLLGSGEGLSSIGAGGTKNGKSLRKRLLVIFVPILLVFFVFQFIISSSASLSSRRTDSHLRTSRRQRSAASPGMGGGGYAPVNFSDPAVTTPPFTFCPSYSSTDEIGNIYGPEAIFRTRAHVGSTERVKRLIKRAMGGLPITIGILGGSVSACHGLDATVAHPLGNPIGPNCYPHRLFTWLNDVFPHPANELTNGALRRTGTSYFGFCSEMHLPDRVDLIIVEFDTEDPHDPTTLATTDLLIRSLLLRPDSPAVIMLGHFSPQIQGEHGFAGPETWHTAVAQFYDIPHLTVKGFVYEEYLLNPQKVRHSYFLDPMLANAKGHELLADTIIAFLESEICSVWESAVLEAEYVVGGLQLGNTDDGDSPSLLGGKGLRTGQDAGLDAEDSETSQTGKLFQSASKQGIPPFRITDRPHTISNFREIKPNCASANDLINPLPQSVFAGSGWNPIVPKPDDEDERHYWFTEEPGSLLKIPIKAGSGDIAVYYLKGPASQGWGTVLCWVDDNTGGAVELRGSWDRDYNQPTVTQIDRGVSKGPHYVVCELQGEPGIDKAKFKIYGVFAT